MDFPTWVKTCLDHRLSCSTGASRLHHQFARHGQKDWLGLKVATERDPAAMNWFQVFLHDPFVSRRGLRK